MPNASNLRLVRDDEPVVVDAQTSRVGLLEKWRDPVDHERTVYCYLIAEGQPVVVSIPKAYDGRPIDWAIHEMIQAIIEEVGTPDIR